MVESMKICKFFEVGQNSVAADKVMSRQFFNFFCDIGSFCRDKKKNQTSTHVVRNSIATHFLYVATKLVLTFVSQ